MQIEVEAKAGANAQTEHKTSELTSKLEVIDKVASKHSCVAEEAPTNGDTTSIARPKLMRRALNRKPATEANFQSNVS